MKLGMPCLFLVLTWSGVVCREHRPATAHALLGAQTAKEQILSLMGELYPQVSGTVEKPNVRKPGAEVGMRIEKELLVIANQSPELGKIVVQTLVDLLEDPTHQNGFYYSAVWSCASSVLGQLKAVEAVDVLSRNLNIQHGALTLSLSGFPAVHGLIKIGEPAVERLEEVLIGTDSKTVSRGLAAVALGEIGGRRAKEALERAHTSEKDPNVIKEIELSLRVLNSSKAPQ